MAIQKSLYIVLIPSLTSLIITLYLGFLVGGIVFSDIVSKSIFSMVELVALIANCCILLLYGYVFLGF